MHSVVWVHSDAASEERLRFRAAAMSRSCGGGSSVSCGAVGVVLTLLLVLLDRCYEE